MQNYKDKLFNKKKTTICIEKWFNVHFSPQLIIKVKNYFNKNIKTTMIQMQKLKKNIYSTNSNNK